MNLTTLYQTFVTLAELGTMSKTADALSYSQPTVSMQIEALEKHYGVPLLEFRKMRYVLTEEGKVLHSYATTILRLVQEASEAIGEFKALERGTLRVGATSNIGVYLLPNILSSFRRKFPGITVSVLIDHPRIIEERVLESALNLGILEAAVADNHRLIVEPWREEPLLLITSPKHPWASRRSIAPDELLGSPFVVGGRGSGTSRVLDAQLGGTGRKIKVELDLGSTEAVKKAVESNLGISIVNQSSVSREIRLGTLQCVPIEGVELHKTFCLIWPRDRHLTLATTRFLSLLRDMRDSTPSGGE